MSKFAMAAEEATRKAAAKRAEANALADKEGGLSKEEAARFDALITEAEAFDAEATENRTRAERLKQNGDALAGYSRPRPRQAADPQGEPIVAREGWKDDPKCGFKTPRDFLQKVIEAPKARRLDERLQFLAAAGSDEHGEYSDPHGNFFVPVGFSPTLMTTPTEADPIAGRTTSIPMTSPVVEWPARVRAVGPPQPRSLRARGLLGIRGRRRTGGGGWMGTPTMMVVALSRGRPTAP